MNRRLSIEADGGAKDHPSGFTRETSYSEGALAIADGEGVMSESRFNRCFIFLVRTDLVFSAAVLHLARMKRESRRVRDLDILLSLTRTISTGAPAVLIDILNDPSIEKQKFGVYREFPLLRPML